MFGSYFYFDSWYLILVVPAILISLIAQVRISTTFKKYSRVESQRHMPASAVAGDMLKKQGLNVPVEFVRGNLTDNYDPRSQTLHLSETVFSSSSIAALGVSAHEVGHAFQHAEGYAPLKLRNSILPVVQLVSTLSIPLIIIGFVLSMMNLVYIGIIAFSATLLFQLITLPVEYNASSRAIANLETGGYLTREELVGARKVLNAAAMTYVAAALVSLAQLLRFILIAGGSNRRN